MKSVMMICASQMLQSDEQSVGPRRERMSCHLAEVVVSCRKRRRRLQASSSSLRCPRVQETGDDDTWRRPMQAGSHYHQLLTATTATKTTTTTTTKTSQRQLFINLICAITIIAITASNLLLVANATESDNSNLIRGTAAAAQAADGSQSQSQASQQKPTTTTPATSSNSSSTLAAATTTTTTTTTTTPPTSTSSADSTPNLSAVLRRDLGAKSQLKQQQQQLLQLQQQSAIINAAGQARKSDGVCQVNDGESVAIIEIEESRGSDTSQTTNPSELPISGSVALGEIELKIESETHKYFHIEDKSLRLTRPLDRDAILKENSTQILQQPITSIYLQISCVDKRSHNHHNQDAKRPIKKKIIPVLVKVLDLNDNAPKFSQPIYSVQVNELAPIGTVILDQLAYAVDLDSANNGQIEYSLLGSSPPAAIATTNKPWSTSSAASLPTSSQMGGTSGLLLGPTSKSIMPPKLATPSSTNQRLVQRAEPASSSSSSAQNQEQQVTATNRLAISTVSSSTSVMNNTVSTTMSPPSPPASSGSSSSSPDSKVSSTNEPQIGPGGTGNESSTPYDYEEGDSGLSQSVTVPTLLQDNLHASRVSSGSGSSGSGSGHSRDLAEPTINLNSEPILNGPMEDSEEDESDEALLASIEAAANNSTDSDGGDQPPIGDQSDLAAPLAAARAYFPRLGKLKPNSVKSGAPGAIAVHQRRRIKRTRRQLPEGGVSPGVSVEPAALEESPSLMTTTANKRRPQSQQTTATTSTTTTMSNAMSPAASISGQQPPWTNLMVIPSEEFQSIEALDSGNKLLASASQDFHREEDDTGSGSPLASSFASNDFFELELSSQTNRPVIRLKRQLDYETKRVHQLTLVATDRAQNKNERLSSQVKIVIRVLDGDDQPPAFILDQVGCATGLVTQPTSPLPPLMADHVFSVEETTTRPSTVSQRPPLSSAASSSSDMPMRNGNHSSASSLLLDLLQQEAVNMQQHLSSSQSSSPSSRSSSAGAGSSGADPGSRRLSALTRPSLRSPPASIAGGDLTASSTNLRLRSFKVTDENFDFGDTLGLDDTPLDSPEVAQGVQGDEDQMASVVEPHHHHHKQQMPQARTRRITIAAGQPGQQYQQPTSPGSGSSSQLLDYSCLAPLTAGYKSAGASTSGQQLAEYFATVISGDSDYLLRVAPQSIKARDRDELNAPIRYSFINGTPSNYSHYFQINPLDATIKQVAPIERSQVNEFVLFIQAQEQSYNKLFSVAKLTIDVLPTDKSPPVLVPNSYSGFVNENSPIGSRVLAWAPALKSVGPPNSIIGNHRSQPNSTTNANSDPNEQPTPPAAFLRIAVLDADKVPAAAEEHGASAGDLSTKYIAHASTGKQAKYEFETTSEAFKVDRDGFVYVNRFPLDRDPPSGSSVYMLQVTARQVGLVSSRSISSPISLNITIGDLNDNPPQLLNSTLGPIQMTANSRGGAQPLIKIEALDRDLAENSQMRFSIQHVSNMGSARFRIDEDSGRIEALGKFQAGEQFSLTVQVADELGRSSQGILDVQVVPGANTGGPQFLTEAGNHHHQHHHHLGMGRSSHGDVGSQTASQASSSSVASLARASYYSVEVNEGVAVNSAILQVRAIDPENDPITYSIIDGNINNDFSINSKTGTLMVANKLDREEISAYKLIVQARDSGGLANSRPIHVLVTDSNDQNPIFNQAQYVFAVEEGVPAVGSSSSASDGYLLGRVSAHDSDEGENGRVSYSLVPLDSGTMTALAGAPYAHAAPATAAVNRQPVFAINSTTGEIRLMQPLDYEQARSHTLLVVAHDNGENPRSSSAMVQVRVLDRQDETPYFEQFHLETRLDENQANQRVALVQARDPDSVAEVTYVLLGGDSSLFQVDPQTGLVTTIGAGLDYEQARLHSLLIGTNESLSKIDLAQATQRLNEAIAAKQTGTTNGSQSPPLERSALIRVDVLVNDLNDNVPQFESGDLLMPVRVQDSVALGSVLPVQIRAHDHDASSPNNQIRYELVTSASASSSSSYQQQQQQQITTSDRCAQLFLIDPSTGQISVRADLKRDSQSECQLIIRARDMPQEGQPSLSSQISLTVYIDHLIEISSASLIGFADSSYTVELGENEPANTLVKLLTIINKPKVATFPMSCEIISGNELGRFYVTENEQRDCELRTRDQLLDYEQRSRFTLVVKLNTVGGGGIGSASGSSGGGSVYHSNINNSGSGSSGGPVTTTSSRSTLAQIQINILDKNDNKPVFSNQPSRYNHLTQNKYLAAIAYDSPSETQLIQLRATDLDSSQANGLISYELLNEQELEGRFKIDAMDGILRTSRPIEDIPQAKLPLRLRVLARDNPERASDSLEASAEVVVNLIDDHHRIALVMKDTPATRVLDNKEELLSVIQERTGLISGLERVESLKVQRNLSLIEADVSGSDVWFYLIEPGSLRIVPSDDPRLKSTLFEARAQNSLADIINQNLGFAKARVRLPYSLTNALNANSQLSSSNLLFGAIRADSNDRLAPILILVSLFIAIISAIVVIYQCGSVAGFSASTNDHNHQQQQQQQHSAQLYPSQLHQHFAKDKFLFSPPPPPPPVPSQYQFVGSTLGSGAGVDIAQAGAHFGSLSRGATLSNGPTANQQLQTQQHALNRSSFGPATSKEYETQMLKMSVLFDDNQSFDDQNNNENYMNVNKNLV